MAEITPESMSVLSIRPLTEDGRNLPRATGFLVERAGKTYVVSNWHVASGKHFQTKKWLPASDLPPRSWVIEARVKVRTEGIKGFNYKLVRHKVELPSDEELLKHCHPEHGSNVDVVAIPLAEFPFPEAPWSCSLAPINLDEPQPSLKTVKVCSPVSIPGYPPINPVPNDFPIYKAGEIATEPQIFGNGEPAFFLVDGKMKGGWSGSPIFVYPGRMNPLGMFTKNTLNGKEISSGIILLGVYSGRDVADAALLEAEMGIGWPIQQNLIPILDRQL